MRQTAQPQMRTRAIADFHIAIIGAGIGGLTAALSLQRHGFGVSIYEQAAELREFGAGLVVTPNAMHALNALGVGAAIIETSNVSVGLLFKHYKTGEILQSRPPGDYYKSKYGASHLLVHRADLHAALSAAVLANDPACIHLDHAFSELCQDENGVVARFVNGATIKADALLGCDGYRSTVRDQVYGSTPVTFTGQVAFRALVRSESLPDEVRKQPECAYVGPGRMLLHYPLRNRALMNIVGNARQDRWEAEGWAIPTERSEFLTLYSDFHPNALQMIGAIEPNALFKWGLRDREPLRQWTLGRVSTLGDAAHPMSPFLGQGAVMAIEDGMVLGRCFAKAGTAEEALQLYEAARKPRANAVQIYSREQGSNLQHIDPGRGAEAIGLFNYNPTTVPI